MRKDVDDQLQSLVTEQRNPASLSLHECSTKEILRIINDEDKTVAHAVEEQLDAIAAAVEVIHRQLSRGGRLIYIGAGTSGRLGIIDAAECPPTFGTPPEMVQGIIAGGFEAMFHSQEGAEDEEAAAEAALSDCGVSAADVVVGISASGRTPFACAGLRYARQVGAPAIAVTCNPDTVMSRLADITIAPNVGPEVITGSTRMKSGTAEKMVLNMLTTATMVKLGKVSGNLMIDIQPWCDKLSSRGERTVSLLTGVSRERARQALKQCGGGVRAALEFLGWRPDGADQVPTE